MADKPDDTKEIKVEHTRRSSEFWVAIIFAVGVVAVNIITAYHLDGKVDAAKEQAHRTAVITEETADEADRKLEHITELTNSNFNGVNNRLEKAYDKIESLEKKLVIEKENEPTNKVPAPDEEKEP